jgi:hypothetical protein
MQSIAKMASHRYGGNSFLRKSMAAASVLFALFLVFSPSLVRAQLASADILGTVTDSTGAVVPNAKVTLLNTGTGIAVTQTSTEVGEFLFSHVQIGAFNVTVEAKGFKKFTATGLTANQGDRLRVTTKLEVGSQVESVQVEASAVAQLQADTSDIGSLIPTDSVSDMPLNGRNYYDLVGRQAGTVTESTNSQIDPRASMSFSANGQDPEYNNNMIDGLDNNERSRGTVTVEPSLDALEEVKVETNNYSAEYSHTGGGIANLVTKSGTNAFHGSLFEYMRNDDFDAYQWNSMGAPKTELRQNQYGGSVGGPILKNKAFFFGDYQGMRIITGNESYAWVPNEAEYESIQAFTPGSGSIALQDQWGASVSVPASAVNPFGLALIKAYPKPSCDGACNATNTYNWFGVTNQTMNADTYDTRIDYHFNDKNTLFGRYSYNKATQTQPGLPPAKIVSGDSNTYQSGAQITPLTAQNLAVDYVHIFSPSTLFEAKAAYLRSNEASEPINSYWTIDKTGIPCSTDYCYNVDSALGFPNVQFDQGGIPYQGLGDNGGHKYVENTFQYHATLTLNRKTHSIKAGLVLMRRQAETPTSGNNFVFVSSSNTGNALGDLVEGLTDGINEGVVMVVQRFRSWEPSGFIQDDWRATKSLTLNLGVRYDIFTPWTERYGHMSNFDLNTDLIVSPSLLGNYEASPTGNIKNDYGDIAPRLGFAYSLPHNMVVRGGWGLSYFAGNISGTGYYQLLNAPFNWQTGCGTPAARSSVTCNSIYPAAALPDGGFNLEYGMPRPVYDISLAENTQGYSQSITGQSNFIQTDFKASYLEQMNLQLQKQLGKNLITVGYVGTLGRRIPMRQDLNQPPIPTASLYGPGQTPPADAPLHYPMYSASTDWMDNVNIYEQFSEATSTWIAGEATYRRDLSHGLGANLNYTWARTESRLPGGANGGLSACVLDGCQMDNGSGGTTTIHGWQEWNYTGSTSHRVAGTMTYKVPFGQSLHGPLGAAVKGWELNGTGYWEPGSWHTIYVGNGNQSLMGSFANHQSTERPNKIASVKTGNKSLSNWFNTSAFALQQLGTLGNAGQNQIQGPHSRDLDLGFGKTFSVYENMKLQFRAEAFNFTNTVNFDSTSSGGGGGGPPGAGGTYTISSSGFDPTTGIALPGTSNQNAGFGEITSAANSPRIFQFGLKLTF